MIEVGEALKIVLEAVTPLAAVESRLDPSALGRMLAEEVRAERDSPPFTKSMMDGYAVRSADLATIPARLRVVEEIAAGAVPTKSLAPGEASAIFTGAPIPDGADAVVMVERTERLSPDLVEIRETIRPGKNVLPRGFEMKAGEVILEPGTVMTPATLGLLAGLGRASARISPWPEVGVLPTGNELVQPGEPVGPGQIVNSNGLMLLAQVANAGAVAIEMGIARDDRPTLVDMIGRGLDQANVLLLAGGVSAGKYDLVPEVLAELGVTPHFHKVRMKPGKPLYFGTRGTTLVFGLPGNPVSAYLGFVLFVAPALRKLRGEANPTLTIVQRPVIEAFRTSNDRPTYHPAVLEGDGVRALPWFGSADLRGLHRAQALLVLPAGDVELTPGQPADVLLL